MKNKEFHNKELYVVIERDQDGIYVGEVPQLRACYAQGDTKETLLTNSWKISVRSLT
jgi:predicted RNase H-like HicB family nuclease